MASNLDLLGVLEYKNNVSENDSLYMFYSIHFLIPQVLKKTFRIENCKIVDELQNFKKRKIEKKKILYFVGECYIVFTMTFGEYSKNANYKIELFSSNSFLFEKLLFYIHDEIKLTQKNKIICLKKEIYKNHFIEKCFLYFFSFVFFLFIFKNIFVYF